MARTALLGAGVTFLAIGASAAALAHAHTGWGAVSRARTRDATQDLRAEVRPKAEAVPRVLHRLDADFVEDEPGGRVLAALTGEVLQQGGRTWLKISASPAGPRVVAPPGPFGVAGFNRLTAEETAAALVCSRLTVRAHGPRGMTTGRALAGAPRDVVERRLLPDGRVIHVVVPFETPSREVWFEVDLEGEGRHEVEVALDGRTRLRATCRVRARSARIEQLAGVGAHEGARS